MYYACGMRDNVVIIGILFAILLAVAIPPVYQAYQHDAEFKRAAQQQYWQERGEMHGRVSAENERLMKSIDGI